MFGCFNVRSFFLLFILVLCSDSLVFSQGACDCTDNDQITVDNSSFEDGASASLYNAFCPPSWICTNSPDTGRPSAGATCDNLISHSCDQNQFAVLAAIGNGYIESISQEINCMIEGQDYYVSFSQGLLHEYGRSSGYLEVDFGGTTLNSPVIDVTAVPFPGFSGWNDITLGPYTATGTSMTIEFIPVSVIDGFANDNYCPGFPSDPSAAVLLLDGVSICGEKGCCDSESCDDTIDLPCDDGDPCTINDKEVVATCDNDVICIPCEGETTVPCSSTINISCDDGDPCTENDMATVADCDNSIICVPCQGNLTNVCLRTEEIPCDDGNICTEDDKEVVAICNNSIICVPCQGITIDICLRTKEVPCDDGYPCTENDIKFVSECDNTVVCIPCSGIQTDPCSSTIQLPCDDGNVCTENDMETVAQCDETIECIPCEGTPITCLSGMTMIVPCDDGDTTTINDVETLLTCDRSVCIPCEGVVTSCVGDSTIILPCDDGLPCTMNDEKAVLFTDTTIVCKPCIGTRITCTDGETEILPCDDGDSTTINDIQTILKCDASICIPCMGVSTDCANGTTSVLPCDDGDPCTINDMETVLDSVGTICIPCAGIPQPCGADQQCEISRMCDDGDPCTINDMETILLSDSSICIPCLGIKEYANVEIDSVVCSEDKATYQVFFSTDYSTESNNESLPFNDLGSNSYSIVEIDSSRSITIILQGTNAGCDTSFQVNPPNCECLAQSDAGNPQTIDCINTFVDLSGVGTSIGTGFTYSWTNSLGIEVGNTASFTTDVADTYILKVIDIANNCEAISTVVVDDIRNNPEAIINAVPSDVIDCSISIILLNTVPQDNVIYTWTNGGQTQTGLRIEVGQSTVVYLLAYDTLTFCSNEDSLFIDEKIGYPLIGFEEVSELTCSVLETSISLDGTSTTGPNIIHQWYDSNNNLIVGEEGENLLITNPGTYYVVSTDTTNNCTERDSVVVIENVDFPSAEAGDELSIPCDEPIISLAGATENTGFSIQWTTTSGQIFDGANSLNPTVSMTGWYYLEVYNPDNQCLSIDSVFVSPIQDAIETIEYDSQSPICFGDTNGWIQEAGITGGTPPVSYTINGVGNTDGQFNDLAPGNYIIEAIDAKGCTFDTSIVLSAPGVITLGLIRDHFELKTDNPKVSLELITTATIIDTIIYQPSIPVSCNNCLNPELSFTESGEYTITLIDANGCVAVTTFNIVLDPTVHIFVPNSFSPNEDGVNDVFFFYSEDVLQVSEFRIFDRWGGVLYQVDNFKSNEIKYAWDGKARGKRVDTGVFVYYIKYLDLAGKEHVLAGDLTVVF